MTPQKTLRLRMHASPRRFLLAALVVLSVFAGVVPSTASASFIHPERDPGSRKWIIVSNNPLRYTDPLGLASLEYWRNSNELYYRDEGGQLIDVYPAGNWTTYWGPKFDPDRSDFENRSINDSFAPAPAGTWNVTGPNRPDKKHPRSVYGPVWYRLQDAHGRTGILIHSGRSSHRIPTNGCVRMDEDDITDLAETDTFMREAFNDPIRTLTIVDTPNTFPRSVEMLGIPGHMPAFMVPMWVPNPNTAPRPPMPRNWRRH